jgi:hypothetical protein
MDGWMDGWMDGNKLGGMEIWEEGRMEVRREGINE